MTLKKTVAMRMVIAMAGCVAVTGASFNPRQVAADQSISSRGVVSSRDPEAFRTPITEVRALWVVRTSITSPEKIRNVVDTARKYGFNTLFVQARALGEAYYNSNIDPRAECLAGQPVSFDPLSTIISDAHTYGIQVHAWVNADFVWAGNSRPSSPDHVYNKHPDWLVRTSSQIASPIPATDCEGAFVSPANPAVRQYNHDIFMEIVHNYDVDGIHFDYIRFPNLNYDYSYATTSEFCADMNARGLSAPDSSATQHDRMAFIKDNGDAWATWRREQVTEMVECIARDAHAAKPGIVVSAAVFADWRQAYVEKGQDWKRWLADGALDAVAPMAYGADTGRVADQIADAERAAASAGRFCYAGIGAWHISVASALAKIEAARDLGAQGIAIFSYGGVTADGSSNAYIGKLASLAFQRPAALPKLPWNTGTPAAGNSSPTVIVVTPQETSNP